MTESASENPRIALVTGAGRGIGRAIADRLAGDGFKLVCVSKSPDSCGAAAEAIRAAGGDAVAYPVDVADGAAVAALCEEVLDSVGTVDVLVNNAGITRDGLLFRMSDEDWDSVIQTNLSSCFHFIKHLGRPMTRKRWGRIVNITSVIGLMGNAGQANYAAAKAGIIGLTKALAKEFAARQVTVNALAPGFIQTDMTEALNDEAKEQITKMIPLKKLGTVEDVAGLAAFLCSEDAGYITGQVFTVDGGMVM
jgi:3-oxoacyl-[acyl-carrier protein] reductase